MNSIIANNKLVIIGSGLAGYMVAKEWRKLDSHSSLTIITADDGHFYSKPLLSTALTQQKKADNLIITYAEAMAKELNAEILTHTLVSSIDPKRQEIILSNDQRLPYSHLVLACGADKIQLPLSGNAVAEIQSVNNLMEYRQFQAWLENKKQIAIIGAGLVGCEFANDLINCGYGVSVIAPESSPLCSLVPSKIGTQLQTSFAKKGVSWHLERFALAVNFSENKKRYRVELDQNEMIEVDGVLAAVGLRPNLRLAQSAGLVVNYGIVVNRYLATSNPNIYALGDCAEVDGLVKQYIAPILQCARALAKTLSGCREAVHYPIMPIVIKTPACPLVAYPPPQKVVGEWLIESDPDELHLKALFHDQQGQLQGYVLTGDKVRDKMNLAKELPLVFSELSF